MSESFAARSNTCIRSHSPKGLRLKGLGFKVKAVKVSDGLGFRVRGLGLALRRQPSKLPFGARGLDLSLLLARSSDQTRGKRGVWDRRCRDDTMLPSGTLNMSKSKNRKHKNSVCTRNAKVIVCFPVKTAPP